MAIGDFVYQAQAPGGIVNQIVVSDPIRAKRRPVEARPTPDRAAIGRTSALDQIRSAVDHGPVQLVAGDGWGKTAILRQAVHDAPLETYRDGVALVSGWGLPIEDIEQAIFEAFFESHLPSMNLKVTPGQLRTSFSDIEAGIAVDDLDLPRQHVERLLDAFPRCTIVSAASQQTMWSNGTAIDVDGMTAEQAVALFAIRLRRELSTAESEAVATYAAAVFGFPMAIVTGAAAVRRSALTFDQLHIVSTATDPLADVTGAVGAALTLRESRILAVLDAVDSAPLPPPAVETASGVEEPEDDLVTLREDGLLQVASPTFRLPNATAVLLDLSDAGTSTVRGLTTWAKNEPDPQQVAAAAAAMTAAMRNASRAGDHAASMDLARAADAGVSVSSKWGLWGQMLAQAENTAQAANDQFQLGWALHQRGTQALASGDTSSAQELLGTAGSIREAIGDTEGLAATRHNLDIASGPPPTVDTPAETSSTPPSPPDTGLPWWAWTMIVVGFAVIGALIVGFILRGDDVIITTTEATGQGELIAESFLDFGRVPVGEELNGRVVLTNVGPGPVAIEGASTADDTFFDVATTCSALDVGQTCEVLIAFSSDRPVGLSTDVAVRHDGANDPLVISVAAEAVEPSRAFVVADPINVDFGPVDRASAASVREEGEDSPRYASVAITNAGDADVTVTDVSVGGDAFFALPSCGDLPSGSTCTIDILFQAIEPGPHEGELVVAHSGDNSPVVIPLSGFVLNAPNLVIEVVDSSEYLGVIPVGDGESVLLGYVITVRIQNESGERVDADFWIHIEQEIPEFGGFFGALSGPSTEELAFRYLIDTAVGSGETIQVADLVIGVDVRAAERDEAAPLVRAVVDSCFGQEFVPPFCMIEESNEDDNTSDVYLLPIPITIE